GGVDGQVRTGSGRPIGRSRVNRGCPERSRTGRRQNQTLALARPEQVFCLATSPAWILSCVLILPSSSIQRRDGGSNNASNLRPLHSALLLLCADRHLEPRSCNLIFLRMAFYRNPRCHLRPR